MTTYIHELVNGSLEGRHLLDHPFYRRWEAGELDVTELTAYAEQYRHFETMLPEFLTALSERMPEGEAREAIAANLADEVASPSHLELFEKFADFYDAKNVPASPAMTALLGAYRDVLGRSDASAIAGLLAYEIQGAGVASTKADGLLSHYGASQPALEFWRVHSDMEGDHADWTMEALEALDAANEDISSGASHVADAWWSFLDEREALKAA